MHIPNFQLEREQWGNWEFTRFIISLGKLIYYLIFTPLVFHTSNSRAVGNGKWEIDCVLPHKRRGGSLEMGNGKSLPNKTYVRDQVGNGKWEIGCGFVEQTKWEMGNGKWPSGKLDVLELPAFGKRETGNWLLNLPRRDILQSTVEGFRSIKTEPFEGCENIVKIGFCLALPWETGNGKREMGIRPLAVITARLELRGRNRLRQRRAEAREGAQDSRQGWYYIA